MSVTSTPAPVVLEPAAQAFVEATAKPPFLYQLTPAEARKVLDDVQVAPGEKMSTPTGDNAFLQELELSIRTDLTLAETSQPEQRADVPITEWLSDTEEQRYEVNLRNLLGAVEAMEDGSRSGEPGPGASL